MKERAQRLALFSAIEGGTPFWTREINERGAQSVFERLKNNGYDSIKHASVIEKVAAFESVSSFQSIERNSGTFIIPGDPESYFLTNSSLVNISQG